MTPQVLDDSVVGDNEKILLYGMPGTGKTFAGGTMPGKVYFLLVGGRNELKPLRSPSFREKYPEKDGQIAYDWVTETRGQRGKFEEAEAFDRACDLLDEALEQDRKGKVPGIESFDSLVIDNATMLGNVQMNKAMTINQLRSKSGSKALKRLREHDIVIPGDNDWMSKMSLMTQFVDWLFSLDKHVLFVAHEWRETSTNRSDHTTNIEKIRPMFTGKNREDIPLVFDNVWRMTTSGSGRSQQFEAQTVGDDTILAKTRFGGVLSKKERDPNMTALIDRMHAATGGEG